MRCFLRQTTLAGDPAVRQADDRDYPT